MRIGLSECETAGANIYTNEGLMINETPDSLEKKSVLNLERFCGFLENNFKVLNYIKVVMGF